MNFFVPCSKPSPLPNSKVVLSSAKIHILKELKDAVHQCVTRSFLFPPYSPNLNPVKLCFGLLKRWIQKHANLVFPLRPVLTLEVAMPTCAKEKTLGLHGHCGYDNGDLRK